MNDAIITLYNNQKDALTKLSEVLSIELDVLKSRDRSLLAENAQEKVVLLSTIAKVDESIKLALSEQIFSESEQQLINEHESDIKELLNHCKHQNKVNGQIITSSQVAINRFKNMLQKSLNNQSATYDSKGLTNLSSNSLGLKA
ncbi:MAG: flagellar export chaperone FlgN [Colwellia sp.]